MRHGWLIVGMLALGGCAGDDVTYCRGFGVEGTTEFGKCIAYFHQQEGAFNADRNVCELEADGTYPQSLYDRGSYTTTAGTFGSDGKFYAGQTIHIDPDYQHNREVDRLRMRIIGPCMQARGWNSASDWQAGRHAVTSTPVPASAKLPWQK